MIRGKSIATTLIVLLLLLFSNDQVSHLSPAGYNLFSVRPRISKRVTTAKAPADVTTHSLRKDKIRVRYMGGECGYDQTAIVIGSALKKFTDCRKEGNYVSFISSSHHFLFKLRGPPALC